MNENIDKNEINEVDDINRIEADGEQPENTEKNTGTTQADESAETAEAAKNEEEPERERRKVKDGNKFLETMKKIWANSIVKTSVILFLITALSAFALSGVNTLTEAPIAENKAKAVAEALKNVFPLISAPQFREVSGYQTKGVVTALYEVSDGTANAGYAVLVSPQGYGGAIEMAVGVSPDGKVTGVSYVKMNETPGLGTKVKENAFISRLIGKEAGVMLGSGQNRVDAVTGATVSSSAVVSGAAEALAAAAEYASTKEAGQ